MAPPAASATDRLRAQPPPGVAVTVTGWLMALWCVGFAVVNVAFEVTDYFADGPNADYAAAITVMNWFVVVLKLLGAAVALLSVTRRPRFVAPNVLGVAVCSVFATLGVYVLGSVVEAVGMVSGLAGAPDQVDLAGVAYVLFFLLAAAGYGVLAISYSRRHALGWGPVVLGVLAAPVVLGLILLAVPTLLAALGLMPAS